MPRPVGAGVLTILGGFFIVGGGLAFALIGSLFAIFGLVSGIFLLGILVGLVTLIVGVLMIALPSGHFVWGGIAIVLAFVSIPVAFGGFIVGFVMTLLGGILAVRWRRPIQPYVLGEGRPVPPPSG
ncbi:MAG: DUF6114 domain-containing protein [Thermoplasmata archaeon]